MTTFTHGTPTNMDEYVRRFQANTRVEGQGVGNVFTHYPCPFCGAAEFMVAEVLQTRHVLSHGAECRECGRSSKAEFIDTGPSEVHMEMVQTGGPDCPEWLVPPMRRV